MPIEPNMQLEIPVIGETLDPEWAEQINSDLETIGAHTHIPPSGVPITSAAIVIDDDLSFDGNNLTSLRTARFQNLGSDPGGGSDVCSPYVKNGDLYYNNASGAHVRLTNGSGLNVSVGVSNTFSRIDTSGNLTILNTDTYDYIGFDTFSSAPSVFLPAASTVTAGRFYYIKDFVGLAASNPISLVPNGSDTIEGFNFTFLLNQAFDACLIVSDGIAAWDIFRAAPSALVNLLFTSVPTLTPPVTIVRNQPLFPLAGSGQSEIPTDWLWQTGSFTRGWISQTVEGLITFQITDIPPDAILTSVSVVISGSLGSGGGFASLPSGLDRVNIGFYTIDGYGLLPASSSVTTTDDPPNLTAFNAAHRVTLSLTSISSTLRTQSQSTAVTIGAAPYQWFVTVEAPAGSYTANSFGVCGLQATFTSAKLSAG